MNTSDALKLAKQMGKDLVEISPNVNPPICKILDYGKFKYDKEKNKKEANKEKSVTKTKEIKLHITTEKHDYQVKLKHAEEFLYQGNKLLIRVELRRREFLHKDLAFDLLKKIETDLKSSATADSPPRPAGRSINMQMSPLPKNQQKPKLYQPKTLTETPKPEKKENDNTPKTQLEAELNKQTETSKAS